MTHTPLTKEERAQWRLEEMEHASTVSRNGSWPLVACRILQLLDDLDAKDAEIARLEKAYVGCVEARDDAWNRVEELKIERDEARVEIERLNAIIKRPGGARERIAKLEAVVEAARTAPHATLLYDWEPLIEALRVLDEETP